MKLLSLRFLFYFKKMRIKINDGNKEGRCKRVLQVRELNNVEEEQEHQD